MDVAKVAIIGFGTVGAGVARILLERGDRLARHAGKRLQLVRVVDADLKRPRTLLLPPGMLTSDVASVINDPEITVAIELIGGTEPARSIVLKLLESGKDVVTANKALLAEHGPELFAAARRAGRSIAFEAAVGGGIPIIAAITQCLAANQIQSVHGILNSTSNFILSQMEESDCEYSAALAEAQQRGYAEANPTLDVHGTDAAQKLAILAHLAFGARINWRDIPRTGIDLVDVADIHYAKELGYSIKLLAVAELVPEGLELHVSPTLVRHGTPLAEVRGAYNAIRVVGDAVGRLFFHGLGAGQMPTASAVIADLIDTVVGRWAITFRILNLWSTDGEPPIHLRSRAEAPGRFYLRLNVDDRPGVMSEISGILSRHGISMASVILHETEDDSSTVVPLMIMTHTVPEGDMAEAMKSVNQLAGVYPGTVRMRVRD
ncbi:MAG: homoserine dehydrogenase [Planctomycetaceae bacterium]|nr:homoserine dehydrogenase [Planctomycetaceae bacterium]